MRPKYIRNLGDSIRALLWATSLCQLATMRHAAGRPAGELIGDAGYALAVYRDAVGGEALKDIMFFNSWTIVDDA